MKILNKRNIIIVIVIGVLAGVLYYNRTQAPTVEDKTMQNQVQQQISNNITAVYKVEMSEEEKQQVTSGVDAFMREYKLPKGMSSAYTLQVDSKLNNALKVLTNPESPESDFHATLYLRKVNGTWAVDQNAGPWCTLEQFEQGKCEN